MLIQYVVAAAAVAALAGGEIAGGGKGGRGGGGGWLGRLVQFHREAFLRDYEKFDTDLVEIKASVETAPEGYTDPPVWDEASVLRLLALVSHSRDPSVRPVKRALRRAFTPTRRYMPYIPPGKNSHDLFPSLTGNIENFIYEDYYYSEMSDSEERELSSDELRKREWERSHTTLPPLPIEEQEKLSILVVRNPVEARLPSARISVRLLRKIMEERALAARMMTPSSKRTRTWLPRVEVTQPLKKGNRTTAAPAMTKADADDGNATTPAADADASPKETNDEPAGDAAATDAPAADGPAADAPAADDAPAEEAPKDDPAAEEAPKDDPAAEEAPKDDAPAEEAPKDDAPAEEAPKDD